MLICFEHVSKAYGQVTALSDIDFEADAGKVVALCGPNGAGKSTFLQLVVGLILPSHGTVNIMGKDPSRDWRIKRTIGYSGDPRDMIGELTLEELLCYLGKMRGLSEALDSEIEYLIENFQLSSKRHERVNNLSDGMRKKASLAQALIGSPALLVLDEPTSGLDLEAHEFCVSLLAERSEQGATLLMGTHDSSLLGCIKPRILLLDQGQITADGGLADLLRLHQCDTAKELLRKLWPITSRP